MNYGLKYELENFIKNYKPTFWRETIGTVMFMYIRDEDVEYMLNGKWNKVTGPNMTIPAIREAVEEFKKMKKENKK